VLACWTFALPCRSALGDEDKVFQKAGLWLEVNTLAVFFHPKLGAIHIF
jgi:hypothetical protein